MCHEAKQDLWIGNLYYFKLCISMGHDFILRAKKTFLAAETCFKTTYFSVLILVPLKMQFLQNILILIRYWIIWLFDRIYNLNLFEMVISNGTDLIHKARNFKMDGEFWLWKHASKLLTVLR